MRYQIMGTAAAILLLLLGAGCERTPPPPPVNQTDAALAAEHAYWAERYRQLRPEAPREFTVPAKPDRRASFAEFEYARFDGLDRHPVHVEKIVPAAREGLDVRYDAAAGFFGA